MPEKFELSLVDVMCEGWLKGEVSDVLVGVSVFVRLEHLCEVSAAYSADLPKAL